MPSTASATTMTDDRRNRLQITQRASGWVSDAGRFITRSDMESLDREDTNPIRLGSKARSCQSSANLLKILTFSACKDGKNRTESKFLVLYSMLWTAPVAVQPRGCVSELQRQTADDSLRRTDHEELVVQRLIGSGVAEEIPDADQHLPFRSAEIHERQGLPDLDVEAGVEPGLAIRRRLRGPLHADRLSRAGRTRERVVHPIQHDDTRGRFGHVGFNCRGQIVDALRIHPQRRWREHEQ